MFHRMIKRDVITTVAVSLSWVLVLCSSALADGTTIAVDHHTWKSYDVAAEPGWLFGKRLWTVREVEVTCEPRVLAKVCIQSDGPMQGAGDRQRISANAPASIKLGRCKMLSGGKSVKISVPPLAPHTVLLRGQERNAGSCTVKLTTEERPDLLYAALASAALFLGARHIANAKVLRVGIMAAFITLFGFVIILVFTLQRIAVPRNFAAAAVMGSLGLWSVVGACAKWLTGSVLPSASAVQAALAEAWESSIGATVIVAVGLTVLGAAHYLDADPSRSSAVKELIQWGIQCTCGVVLWRTMQDTRVAAAVIISLVRDSNLIYEVISDSLMLAQTLLPTCLPYASAVAAPVAALLRHLLALLARALRTATGRRRGAASPRKSTPDSSPQPAPAPICGLSPVGMDAKGGRWSVEGREERNAHAHGALDRKAGSPARARSPDSGVRSRFHRNRAPPGAPLHLQAWPVERNLFASDNDPGSPTSGRGLSPDVDVGKGLRIGRRKVEHQGGSRGGQEKGALGHRGGIAADRMAGKSGERAPGGGQAGEGLGERSGADEKAMGRGRGWQGPAANTRRGRGRSGATELEGRAGRVRGKEEEEKEEEEIVRREVPRNVCTLVLADRCINPLTRREITIGGPKYTQLVEQGYVLDPATGEMSRV